MTHRVLGTIIGRGTARENRFVLCSGKKYPVYERARRFRERTGKISRVRQEGFEWSDCKTNTMVGVCEGELQTTKERSTIGICLCEENTPFSRRRITDSLKATTRKIRPPPPPSPPSSRARSLDVKARGVGNIAVRQNRAYVSSQRRGSGMYAHRCTTYLM